MSHDLTILELRSSDAAVAKLREFGNSLKPVDERNCWFWQIIFELVDATVTNYQQLSAGYNEANFPLLAWACRNLLELAILTKYVLISEDHARRFAEDRLIDGCDIITSLKKLELYIDPQSDTIPLDDALARMQAQKAAEGVTANRFLATSDLADTVGMKEEFAYMNRVCSKLVHPTSWSILAVNKGENAFPELRPILFRVGVGYLCDLYLQAKVYNETHGTRPTP